MKNAILFISLLFISCTTQVEPVPDAQLQVPTALMNQKEKDMIVLTNAYRIASGVKKYKK